MWNSVEASPQSLLLTLTGVLSGFVDSIAGGGGLINLPVLTLVLGPGADAIGTNKIAGAVAAGVALMVYTRQGHMNYKKSIAFTAWIGIGALLGSLTAPHLPLQFFRWILFVTCPAILWVIWKKDLWVQREEKRTNANLLRIGVAGLFCGFYDGVWGPGGGTFMFLSLLLFARLPLLTSMAASKLANTCSALVALCNYAFHGNVHWFEGSCVALGIAVGAFFGARHATRNAAKVVRPVLVFVVVLLLIKLALS